MPSSAPTPRAGLTSSTRSPKSSRLEDGGSRPPHPGGRVPDRQRGHPPAGREPGAAALQEGVVVGLANHTVLIAKDGTGAPH